MRYLILMLISAFLFACATSMEKTIDLFKDLELK